MINKLLLVLSLAFCCLAFKSCEPFGPRIFYGQQIKDSSSQEKLIIYFNTISSCPRSYAQLITKAGILKLQCSTTSLKLSANTNNYQTYIHRCRTDLVEYESAFHYNVFGWDGSSTTPISYGNYTQTRLANPLQKNQQNKFIVLADWSKIENNLYKYTPIDDMMLRVKAAQNINGLIILGDIGYDLDSNNGLNYEKFLVMLAKVAADIPILMVTGNHQYNTKDNWQLYAQSFETYGLNTQLAVGLNLGPLHLVTFDPYSLLYSKNTTKDQTSQKLTEVLVQAKNSGRFVVPCSHYPLACSGTSKNCKSDRILMKSYWDSMLDNDVSLYLGAHYHTYQRIYPYAKGDKFTTQTQNYSSNGGYLISIVQGVAGNDKDIVESIDKIEAFTATHTVGETGFGILQVSQTNVAYRHLSTAKGQVDRINITLQKSQKKRFGLKMLREQ